MLCWDFYSLCINGYFQVVVAYNPLGWNRTDIIKIPVSTCLFCDGDIIFLIFGRIIFLIYVIKSSCHLKIWIFKLLCTEHFEELTCSFSVCSVVSAVLIYLVVLFEFLILHLSNLSVNLASTCSLKCKI